MKRRTIAMLACLTAIAAAGGWWLSARTPRWNVVLITLDTTRADRLGCYGESSAVTPRIDRLASQGVLFEQALTVVPITLPAHTTLLTGLLPPEHGLRINGTSRLSGFIPTLAEILQQRDYRTGAFVSSLVLDARFGLARGFESYDDRLENGPDGPRAERPAAETVLAAMTWLETVSSEPFLCWVHLYDPHEPYDEHRRDFGDRFDGRPYDAEIAYMDRHIGRLLDFLTRLGVDDRTLIVIVGDHGEGLGEHQEATHGYLAYNSTMHVPLVIRQPAQELAGSRVAEPVSLADVFPTILEALAIEVPAGTIGRSLLPLREFAAVANRPCYGETEAPLMEGGWCPLRTWTTDRWKLIQSTVPELYDLQADPHETQNVFEQQSELAAQLGAELADFESRLKLHQGTDAVLSEQEQRALESLGYARGHFVPQQGDKPRRDIKQTLLYAEQVHQCMHLIDRNELAKAQRILEGVVEALPDYPKAWGTLGVCFAKHEDYPAAERHFRQALALDANQNFARIGLGRALYAQDRLEECVEQLKTAVTIEPAALDAQYFLGESCRRLQNWDASRAAFEAALEIARESNAASLAAEIERELRDLIERRQRNAE